MGRTPGQTTDADFPKPRSAASDEPMLHMMRAGSAPGFMP